MTTTTHDELHDHDRGLSHDLPKLVERGTMARRGVLGAVRRARRRRAGRVRRRQDSGATTTSTARRAAAAGGAPPAGGGARLARVDVADGEIPEETAGPYPGDGSNGVNVLTETRHRAQRHHLAASAPPPGSPRACR